MNATPGTGNTATARRVPSKRLSPRIVDVRRKQAEAARLFGLGVPLREIAEQVGYESKAGASRAVKAVLNRADSVEADTIRAAHEERLGAGYRAVFEVFHRVYPSITVPEGMDAAEGAVWVGRVAAVIEERADLRLKAVDRLVRLMERESRLHGLDMPLKTEVSGGEPINVLFSAALRPHPAAEIAQYERELIGARTREGMAQRRAEGVQLGRRLELDPAVRARILAEHSDGSGWSAIARSLNADKVATAHGGVTWYPATVRKLVLGAKVHASTELR